MKNPNDSSRTADGSKIGQRNAKFSFAFARVGSSYTRGYSASCSFLVGNQVADSWYFFRHLKRRMDCEGKLKNGKMAFVTKLSRNYPLAVEYLFSKCFRSFDFQPKKMRLLKKQQLCFTVSIKGMKRYFVFSAFSWYYLLDVDMEIFFFFFILRVGLGGEVTRLPHLF